MLASREDITSCRFDRWYHLFTGRTFKSKVISLPPEFVDYLGEDGVVLPESSKHYFSGDVLSDDEDEHLREVVDTEVTNKHDFSDLDGQIASAIRELGGDVMVKLNWSCPLDATWANAGTLKCKSASDIYMLLKSSDRIMFDLEHMYDLCPAPNSADAAEENKQASDTLNTVETSTGGGLARDQAVLVVRKWANLNPAMEFRVFVHGKQVVGICQRDCSTFYDFLEGKMDEVQDLIYAFFYGDRGGDTKKSAGSKSVSDATDSSGDKESRPEEKAGEKTKSFSVVDTFPLSNYVMDVYVDNRNRVWVEDFNPFGEPTCSLLFEWDELCAAGREQAGESSVWHAPYAAEKTSEAGATTAGSASTHRPGISATAPMYDFCEFRIIEDAASALPSTKGSTRGPIDVHAASEFSSFMKLCKAQHAQGDSDSDSS
jgi:hypothetical protein